MRLEDCIINDYVDTINVRIPTLTRDELIMIATYMAAYLIDCKNNSEAIYEAQRIIFNDELE